MCIGYGIWKLYERHWSVFVYRTRLGLTWQLPHLLHVYSTGLYLYYFNLGSLNRPLDLVLTQINR